MAGFSFLTDIKPFDGVDIVCDYRISGTAYPNGDHSFDTVEVPGHGQNVSWDGWRTIKSGHPLFAAVSRYLDTPDAAEQARLAIRDALEGERSSRETYVIYRHAAEQYPTLAALGIPPARLIRSLRAQGAIPERA